MTRLIVAGGRLQGTEVLYLAKKAGFETVLIDCDKKAIGQNISHSFICQNVIQYSDWISLSLPGTGIIVPAMENPAALRVLRQQAAEQHFHLLYDEAAYTVTASKLASDKLMHEQGIPAPRYWPHCGLPCLVKPSGASGSEGVAVFREWAALEQFLRDHPQNWVAEEYLEGPSYSIEVIGTPGHYRAFAVTELFMDGHHDCKRVIYRPDFPERVVNEMRRLGVALAEMVSLHGIMDVEVIDDGQALRVLEIDARFPSQTPLAIYYGCGVNLLRELCRLADGSLPATIPGPQRWACLEHLLVTEHSMEILGEHIMTDAAPLRCIPGFMGADEALTDYENGQTAYRATIITTAGSEAELNAKREAVFAAIRQDSGRPLPLIDQEPEF